MNNINPFISKNFAGGGTIRKFPGIQPDLNRPNDVPAELRDAFQEQTGIESLSGVNRTGIMSMAAALERANSSSLAEDDKMLMIRGAMSTFMSNTWSIGTTKWSDDKKVDSLCIYSASWESKSQQVVCFDPSEGTVELRTMAHFEDKNVLHKVKAETMEWNIVGSSITYK
jgi:hypothetical protein